MVRRHVYGSDGCADIRLRLGRDRRDSADRRDHRSSARDSSWRGIAGQQRIIDWIVLDVNAVFFPNSARDNFHAGLGLVDYGFRWHVGDRLTLLSDGFYDGFDQGLRQVTAGALMSRPQYGSVYVGYRQTEGPITSEITRAEIRAMKDRNVR